MLTTRHTSPTTKEFRGLSRSKSTIRNCLDLIEQEVSPWQSVDCPENFTSRAVMDRLGSALTNKYAERPSLVPVNTEAMKAVSEFRSNLC
jgi:hypothetical protein